MKRAAQSLLVHGWSSTEQALSGVPAAATCAFISQAFSAFSSTDEAASTSSGESHSADGQQTIDFGGPLNVENGYHGRNDIAVNGLLSVCSHHGSCMTCG
jgi:hypothetical protein